MTKIQSTYLSVLHWAILVIVSVVWNFAAFDSVYAEQQSYIYVSDLIQGQSNINSEREIWKYQHEIPHTFRDNDYLYQKQYTYLPPTQKIGSNPFSNDQYKYQFSLNNDTAKYTNVAGNVYHYPPAVQKIGSNPFIKAKIQYVTPYDTDDFFASSCDCQDSDYLGVFANY